MIFDTHTLVAQGFGFAAAALFCLAYQLHDPRKTQMLFVPGDICYGIQFFLLGSSTGALVMVWAMLRDLAGAGPSQAVARGMAVFYLLATWGIVLVTGTHWQEYFLAASSLFSTASIFLRHYFYRYRFALLGRQVCVLAFNVWIFSLGGILQVLFSMNSNLIGIARSALKKKELSV